jgi:hypothetical protein
MKSYSSNQDFYNHIDSIVELLRTTSLSKSAEKIHFLLHKVAWTTTSELFGELRKEFHSILKQKSEISKENREALNKFITTIDDTWGKSNK